jgi:hypothetical protein
VKLAHSPLASAKVKKYVALYIHSPIRLHGIVLNELSTGAILPFNLDLLINIGDSNTAAIFYSYVINVCFLKRKNLTILTIKFNVREKTEFETMTCRMQLAVGICASGA